jgi:hypothetical protein
VKLGFKANPVEFQCGRAHVQLAVAQPIGCGPTQWVIYVLWVPVPNIAKEME